ncbi:hypothetical protein A3F27_03460 [Candidatus Kaiserbacteria bacterium RIFCSPHIGHO2_12_FULL_53_13]|uniref:Uncharacterized protein n=1 Tax=Candidatus Kaiserbacteria bacterium RIFCSPHIGHO2_12_FULL_53_13 TaxID=1798502 RepID=A0A1F6EB43_9BACT|nr:MAG: hypothetical protein A3F27_03460 [Candidatus Kaiserbacteria bacterium RIFCSPHIGHO2_12_FULL_53_13]
MSLAMSLARDLFTTRLQVAYCDDFDGAVAILGAQFNRWESEVEGAIADPSNAKIARIIEECWTKTGLPVFVQSEHAVLLRLGGVPIKKELSTSSAAAHVRTDQFLKWAAQEVRALGRGNVVIVCGHGDHSLRFAALARHYGLDPIVPSACRTVPYADRKIPGDQFWARTRGHYIPWEYVSRLVLIGMHMFRML